MTSITYRKFKKILSLFFCVILLSFLTLNLLINNLATQEVSTPQEKFNPADIKKYNSSVENNICQPGKIEFEQGLVSLTFDDGWESIYRNAIPILNHAGIKSTQYIPAEIFASSNNKYMTFENALDTERAGHEIGSHAIRHKRFTEMSNAEIQIELSQSKKLLLQKGFRSVDTFAYPYGEYTSYSVELSRGYYHAARTTDPGMNDLKTDPHLLYVYQLQNWMTFPYLKRWVDRASGDKKWLIFVFHQVEEPNFLYYTSPKDLILLVNYLIEKKVPIMTVRDVISQCYTN